MGIRLYPGGRNTKNLDERAYIRNEMGDRSFAKICFIHFVHYLFVKNIPSGYA